jgi:flagellar hook-associated protein 2
VALAATGTPSGVGVSPGDGAVAGRYGVRVERLASPAKARSEGLAPDETVRGGTLALTVMGQSYEVTVSDGASLESVAWALNHSGAPVNAAVLDDGTHRYLSLTPTDTGYPVGGTPADALTVVETSTGTTGRALKVSVFQEATNAVVHVDGLRFERSSNEVSGAIPGVTLSLQATGSVAEDLVIAHDLPATTAKLKTFVDAYNSVIAFVQAQLAVTEASDREGTLAGDSAVRTLQASLQQLITSAVREDGSVRTLADLGVKTERNGSLSLDPAVLGKALVRDPRALDELFTTAEAGIAARMDELVDRYIDTGGILASRKQSLQGRISDLDDEIGTMETRIETYRERLLQQFTAMENVVAGLRSMGNYLDALSKRGSSDD